MKRALAALCTLSLLLAAGCSQRIGDFTLISTKNVDIGGKYKKLNERYKADDTKGMILGIPLGVPSLKTAVDNCIEAGKGDLLTNAVLESSFWTVIVWGQVSYSVAGDVWVRAETGDLMNPSIDLYELEGGPQGYQLVSVSNPQKTVKVDYLVYR
jgi:hypothetical protein